MYRTAEINIREVHEAVHDIQRDIIQLHICTQGISVRLGRRDMQVYRMVT